MTTLAGATFPIEYARGVVDGRGFLGWATTLGAALAASPGQLQMAMQDVGLDTVATLWLDNSLNTTQALRVQFVGTGQILSVPAKWQGFYPVLCTPGFINITWQYSAALTSPAPAIFLNKESIPLSWIGS